MPDRSGTYVDKYLLLRLLGKGGNGEVYLAEYSKTQYAVKILHSRLSADGLQDFLNEARNYLVDHPHIMRLRDFGVFNEFPFLVMDFMQQGTLRQRHPRENPPSYAAMIVYLRQVADALQYVHEKGIVHRDVKPENLLIGPNDEIILSDFGIATTSYTVNPKSRQIFAGSMSYVAPEQISEKAVRESDQYSLAIIVYEWLTGAPPFQGTGAEVMNAHMRTPPPSLCQKNPLIPLAVEHVVLKALAKDYRQRYKSVIEFIDALEQANNTPEKEVEREASFDDARPDEYCLVFDQHTEAVRAVAWSPGGGEVASAGIDEKVYIWKALSGKVSFGYHAHLGDVWCVTWSPDGKCIASAGDDASIQIWRTRTKEAILTYCVHNGPIYGLSWSLDGKYIASASEDESVQVWDVGNEQLKHTYVDHQSPVIAIAWVPSSDFIASGDKNGAIHTWGITTGRCLWTASAHEKRITSLAWSRDGKYIASGSYDATVKLWEAATGRLLYSFEDHTSAVTSVSWSPDGKYIASGSWDTTMRIWEFSSGRCIHTCRIDKSWVNCVSWSPDGVFIAFGCWDHLVRVWQAP